MTSHAHIAPLRSGSIAGPASFDGVTPRAEGVGHATAGIVCLRMFSSLAWLISAFVGKDAKLAPSFLSGAGLAQRVSDTFVHSAIAPFVSDLLRNVVLPHAQLFAIFIAAGDLAIGVSLSLGLFTRAGGMLAIVRALMNIAIAGKLGMDTLGFNALLAFVGAVAIVSAAGRRWGVDVLLLRRWPASRLLRCFA